MLRRPLAAACLGLVVAASAAGQTTGSIVGTLADASGGPLRLVEIVATSPQLLAARHTTSDERGFFALRLLPPGRYRLAVILEDQPQPVGGEIAVALSKETWIEVRLGAALSEETDAATGGADVTIVVDPARGALDLVATTFERLPIDRSFQAIAFFAPGAVEAAGPQPPFPSLVENPSLGGSSVAENRYLVDGLDVTDPAFGIAGLSLPFEFVQEIAVVTGGAGTLDGGAPGGVVNLVTRSGSDQHRGSVFGYRTDDRLDRQAPASPMSGRFVSVTEEELGVEAGGPIARERLWYFAAAALRGEDLRRETGQGLPVTTTSERRFLAGKLTGRAGERHQWTATLLGESGRRDDEPMLDAAGLVLQNLDRDALAAHLRFDSVLDSRSALEVAAGTYRARERERPAADLPSYVDITSDARWVRAEGCAGDDAVPGLFFVPGCRGGWFVRERGDRDAVEVKGRLSLLRDRHELELGAQLRRLDYDDRWHRAGGVAESTWTTDLSGAPVEIGPVVSQGWYLYDDSALLIERAHNGWGRSEEAALSFSDVWRPREGLTLRAGLRLAAVRQDGSKSATDPRRRLRFDPGDLLAPGLNIAWDPRGRGRTTLFALYERSFESVPLDLAANFFSTGGQRLWVFAPNEGGRLPTARSPGILLDEWVIQSALAVDPQIEPTSVEQVAVGLEQQLGRSFRLTLRALRRDTRDAMEDVYFWAEDGNHSYLTNPGGRYESDPVTGEPLAEPVSMPSAWRRYRALEAVLRGRPGDAWDLYASWVLSRAEGNYQGLYWRENSELYPHTTFAFTDPALVPGSAGPQPFDRTHQVKVFAARSWRWLSTGTVFRWFTGTPISRFGSHPLYGPGLRPVGDRGDGGRMPDVWSLDFRLELPLRLSGALELSLVADLFNVTDQQRATAVDELWTWAEALASGPPDECGGPGTGPGTSCPAGNPSWGEPTAFQQPRVVRLGARLRW